MELAFHPDRACGLAHESDSEDETSAPEPDFPSRVSSVGGRREPFSAHAGLVVTRRGRRMVCWY